MVVVGLTGGIGTGKSTVAGILRDTGVPVIDADQVARTVVEPGSEGLRQIVHAFGEDVLDDSGALDRARMRHRIIHDADAKGVLEGITHPLIGATIADHLSTLQGAGHAHAVVEAALMVETGSYRLYAHVLVVTCRPEVQVERVMSRDGVSEADARALISRQLPLADKEAVATAVIRNDGDLSSLEEQTLAVWSELTGQG